MFAKLNLSVIGRAALPLALCLQTASSAWAQAGASCVENGTAAQIDACAVQKYQQADTALNIYYGDVMTALSAHERPQLRQDQNNWHRTRRDYCNRQTRASEGRPDWSRAYHACMVSVTQARRGALSQWLHNGAPPPPEASLPPQSTHERQ
ncbi:lysozyme inhibitor LprI family protein [Diaphorobacter ruginosibacter]|uniref:lysozyme inhibitor LprI family protein n=1 Tax=Diaphorobacter ruginosibacter TaxID=1715720 RepID=UPI003342808B